MIIPKPYNVRIIFNKTFRNFQVFDARIKNKEPFMKEATTSYYRLQLSVENMMIIIKHVVVEKYEFD